MSITITNPTTYISCSKSGNGNCQYRIRVQITQDQEKNTSTLTFMGQLKFDASYGTYDSAATPITFKVGQSTFALKNKSWSNPTSWSNVWTAAKTLTLAHKDDGTLEVEVSFSYESGTSRLGKVTLNDTLVLPTIVRATVPVFSAQNESGEFLLGEPITIELPRINEAYVHDLTYAPKDDPAGDTGAYTDAAGGIIGSNIGASCTWTPPLELASHFPNAASREYTITVLTYLPDAAANERTEIGAQTATITLKAGQALKPTLAHVICAPDTVFFDDPTLYIQGQTKLTVEAEAQGAYGAMIRSLKYKVGSAEEKTYSLTETDEPTKTTIEDIPLSEAGEEIEVEVRAVDSRGLESNVHLTAITVHPYALPTLQTPLWCRCTEDGTEDDEGTFVKLTVKGSYSPVGGKNSVRVTATHEDQKLEGDAEPTTEDAPNGRKNFTRDFTFANISADGPQTIEVKAYDLDTEENTVTLSLTVPSATPWFDLHASGAGMAVGKTATEAALFDVGLSSRFRNDVQIDGSTTFAQTPLLQHEQGSTPLLTAASAYPVGSLYSCSPQTSPADLWGGAWELAEKRFTPLSVYYDTANYFTHNTSVVNSHIISFSRAGGVLAVDININNKVILNDSSLTLGNFNLEKLGITGLPYTLHVPLFSDGGNAYLMSILNMDGSLVCVDTIPGDIAVGNNCYGTFSLPFTNEFMLDAACHEFLWRRVE